MPTPEDFRIRLGSILEAAIQHFGTPFHIYDETGIRQTGEALKFTFAQNGVAFREFFAVKALPNPHILGIMSDLGFGFDCSSPSELSLCQLGGSGQQLIFTSTNTRRTELEAALAAGALINLDDVGLLDKLPAIPERISFRFNPGPHRKSGAYQFIGDILATCHPAASGYSFQHVSLPSFLKATWNGTKIHQILRQVKVLNITLVP